MAGRPMKCGPSAVVWVICGAGKGVGKTHLARSLCGILPGVRYAKLGHGRRRKNGPPGYFDDRARFDAFVSSRLNLHDHLVLESNAWAREGRGDVVVFVEATPGLVSLRPDAAVLRRKADIVVGPGGSVRAWGRLLRRWLPDTALRMRVCDALKAQAHYCPATGLGIRSKVWFVRDGARVFGAGLAKLCGAMHMRQSLTEAAWNCGVSYRHAWNLIRTAERRFGAPLTVPRVGGADGGGSRLSPEGEHLLNSYKEVAEQVQARATEAFQDEVGMGGWKHR